MDVTILRLPHMQVVLNEQEEKAKEEEQEEEEMRSKRRRLDSSGQGSGSEETPGETKRREPAHRRKNRQRVKQQQKQQIQNALVPPKCEFDDAEITALQQEGGLERSMIEELLKKYGFGRWTKPEEVWKGRNISRLSEIPESSVNGGSS